MKRRSQAIQGSNQNREVLESPGFSRGENVNSEEAWMASARLERMACVNICREVAEQSNIASASEVAKTIEIEISER